jgi:membrane associated rhomboid family serine protease
MSESPAGVPTCYRHPGRETHITCQRCERPICPDCMRDAAVGFQCPTCVAEGRKQTRSGRTAYGGMVPSRPGLVTMVLIGINAVVWLAIGASGGYASKLYEAFALLPRTPACPAVPGNPPFCSRTGVDGAPWEMITSVFTHVDLLHIAFNMYMLWVLGPQLEAVLGRLRFAVLYLLAGLAGSVAVLWLSADYSSTVGASGAIFGLIGAMLLIGHKIGSDMSSLWVLLGINLVFTFVASDISWQGHLGGLAGGTLVAAILAYAPRKRRSLVQGAGLAGVLVVLAVATVVRIAALA